MDIVIYLDTLLLNFVFQFTNRRPRGVTPDPIVVQGHVVPHLKALMYGYLEPEAQERGSPFTMYHALSKIGVL